jgi:outer membrane protein OmpA-like peptidoglycan-associated protein
MSFGRGAWVGAGAVLLLGCAAALPPKELVDARAAFQQAQGSQAAQLTPVPLHDAKLSLDAAEQAFQEDATSERTRDLSYVALRKAELARAQGDIAGAAAQKEQATRDLAQLQTQNLQRAQAGMQAAQAGMQAAQGELSKTKAQLNMTAEQLAAEKKAREEAEKRTREAMDKLAVAAALAVKEEPRGTVITIPGSVLFPSNKYDLLPAARDKLNQVADALKNQEDHKMVVEGHTDAQGTEASNMELSQKRAQSVRDYLVTRGVPAEKISATGLGQGRPIADNKSAEGRANNRRVEIIVQPIEKR